MTTTEQPQEAPSSAPEEGVQDEATATQNEAQETTSSSAEEVQEDQESTPKREARYRREAREAQAQVEAITTQRDDFARQLIESQLPNHLTPRAFWKFADNPASFISDDGQLNTNKIQASITSIQDDLGLNRGPVVSTAGKAPEKRSQQYDDFREAFKPRDKRQNPNLR